MWKTKRKYGFDREYKWVLKNSDQEGAPEKFGCLVI